MEEINQKLNKVVDTLTEIQVSQARMEVSIAEHIRRTNLLEEQTEMIRQQMVPIQKHVEQVRFMSKIIIWIAGAFISIATALLKLIK